MTILESAIEPSSPTEGLILRKTFFRFFDRQPDEQNNQDKNDLPSMDWGKCYGAGDGYTCHANCQRFSGNGNNCGNCGHPYSQHGAI